MPKGAYFVKKIFIVAPGNWVSGGPEVLHQLGDVLNGEYRRAWMLYFPTETTHDIHHEFKRYNVSVASVQDVEPNSIVVLPEAYAPLIGRFPQAQIYFWWLSVDNFFVAAEHTRWGNLIGGSRLAKIQLRRIRRNVRQHIFQSDYARAFLESNSLAPTSHLGDYLAEEYIQAATKPRNGPRENILVYNPAKGAQQTDAVLQALKESGRPLPSIVPLIGMTRAEVCDVLGRSKVYIDFGGHPGKDRIPREAVALGASIIVNRRGSAANSVDMPIAEEFKIDDNRPEFAMLAAEKIHELMDDFERQAPRFDAYRQLIALEPTAFRHDAQSVFSTIL
jgi:hypothetical protein